MKALKGCFTQKKVNSGLSIIRRLRDIVDYNTLITIYKSIIQPHFDYCSQVWGCLGKVLSDKLQRLQNRAFRIITREGYETRSKDILNKVGFPDLKTRREQQLATLMYKIKHKMLPNYLTRYAHLHTWSPSMASQDIDQFNYAMNIRQILFRMKKSLDNQRCGDLEYSPSWLEVAGKYDNF